MDTIETLKQIIHREFEVPPADVDPDAPFADYNLDSLTVAELLFAVEDEFHVQVPDEAATTVTNLRGLAGLLDELCAAKAA
ncbi:acyl carrier protein [Ramlibacter sp. G-1-2-2]|uniref:Acyl carrier protein n=1 Tax=Ramlibacter agri TaxID=2728837 RepID=A0A848HAK5_9BURK|nr:phosphopantetheine-binding protein [Ramlibacter agri]NML44648.1 acyl carrier protein [Ramlibacter agri]